jgi:hypothetical protein
MGTLETINGATGLNFENEIHLWGEWEKKIGRRGEGLEEEVSYEVE